MTRRWAPRGLRNAVVGAFAVGSLLLATALALGTYLGARHLLVQQREQTAQRQAFADAAIVRQGLLVPGARVSDVLGTVSPPADSTILVRRGDRWFSSSLDTSSRVIPAGVADHVRRGTAAVAWSSGTHPPSVVVGLPLPGTGSQYFEVAVARELDDTLTTLRTLLLVSAALAVVAGVASGTATARRVVRPLRAVTSAATRISSGDLSARLEESDDPDLDELVHSFNDMVDKLDRRIRRDTRFAADLAHELRSPLTTLTTSVSVIRNGDGLSDRTRQAADMMATELDRFRQSLEDLLELGSLEAGLAEVDLAPVDLVTFLGHVLQADGRDVALLDDDAEAAAGLPVAMDRRRLARAFSNLFRNADRHGDGLRRVSVHQGHEGHGGHVEVWVEDAGPGVDPDEREHVFERFARAGSRGSRTGTGLGLSIVSEIVALHGGSVSVEDAVPVGARFVVRLPLAPTQVAR